MNFEKQIKKNIAELKKKTNKEPINVKNELKPNKKTYIKKIIKKDSKPIKIIHNEKEEITPFVVKVEYNVIIEI